MFRLSADEIDTQLCKRSLPYIGLSILVDIGFSVDEEMKGIGSCPRDAFGVPRS